METSYCLGCAARIDAVDDACPHCGMAASQGHPDAAAHAATPVDWPPRMPSGVFVAGGYRIERFIARGGMGEVYEGTDTKLERRVAIKFLADEYRADRVLVQRFQREARAVASLDHPNIVAVFAVGDHEGRPLMVMKYIDGHTVSELVKTWGRLSLRDAIDVTLQVCEGLTHLHARGYVHRDIKPQNLMVDRSGRAMILDFGILRPLASAATATGMVFGTPAYMPPEQAKDAKLVDARSDLYALGVSLFEMLTGQLPFRAPSGFELLMKHQLESAPSPSSVVPGIPAGIDEVVQRAMAKDPTNRYASAADLGEALRSAAAEAATPRGAVRSSLGARVARAAGESPVTSLVEAQSRTTAMAGESLRPPTRPPTRERRWAVALGAVAAVALASVATFVALRGDEGPAPPRPAESLRAAAAGSDALPSPMPSAPSPAPPAAPKVAASPPVATAAAPVGAVRAKPDDSEADDDADETPRPRRVVRKRAAAATPAPKLTPTPPTDSLGGGLEPPSPVRAPVVAPGPPVPSEGTLRIVTLHAGKGLWARILLNGKDTGNRTHVWSQELPVGTYTVGVERDGFVRRQNRIKVQGGETTHFRFELHKVLNP